jgi:hypothetical protein
VIPYPTKERWKYAFIIIAKLLSVSINLSNCTATSDYDNLSMMKLFVDDSFLETNTTYSTNDNL